MISLTQVLNSLGIVFSIPYPSLYNSLIAYLSIFSLDIFGVMPLGCSVSLNHDHYLLVRTLVPIVLLGVSFLFRWRLKRGAARKRSVGRVQEAKADEALADQLLSYNFILVYLLFPSTSAAIFATFLCETLDDAAQSSFMRADFSVDCNSSFHRAMMGYSAAMIFV